MSYDAIERNIVQWAKNRKIIPNSTPQAQLLKAFEEMGELAAATARNNDAGIVDAVGDVMVCLVNYCSLKNISLVGCMHKAYDEIKDRRGTMTPEGFFVKE